MKKSFVIFLISVATVTAVTVQLVQRAHGQQQPPDPQMQALTGQLVDEMQQVIQWRARAMSDEAQIAKLQDELAKLKAKDPKK